MATKSYSFSDALRLTGVERGHLARWAELGVIAPDLGGGGVSGSHRRYSFRNIFEIAVAVEIRRMGVHNDFLKTVFQRLRMLDIDTVATVDIPANRIFAGLPPAEQRKKLAIIHKQGFNPLAHIETVTAALNSEEDSDAKRWNRFKTPSTRGDMLGFLLIGVMWFRGFPNGGTAPQVSFVSSFDAFVRNSRDRGGPGDESDIFRPTSIVIDARRILERLERETGDSL